MKRIVLLILSVMLCISLFGCSGGKEDNFSDWKFVYLDYEKLDYDIIAIQYKIKNSTSKNWEDKTAFSSGSNQLKLGSNEYDWYYPNNADIGSKQLLGFDGWAKEPKEADSIMGGQDLMVMVCFRVNPNDFSKDMKNAKLKISYKYLKYTKEISYEDFEVIKVNSWDAYHGWTY
ncbi:MAG: hypothetical protein IJC38_10320 [Erysipelotrichaceae bacterium]|nr:hypothetical protein [Erysipelotrichaceae bacterium]